MNGVSLFEASGMGLDGLEKHLRQLEVKSLSTPASNACPSTPMAAAPWEMASQHHQLIYRVELKGAGAL